MAKRTSQGKYILITTVAVIVALVAIVIGVVVSQGPTLDDDYFVSDETKLVMSLNKDMAAFEEGPYEPDVTHLVYFYSGDTVTGMQIYFEYDSEEEARLAYGNINMKDKDFATTKRLNGRYVVFDAVRVRYEGLTVEQVQKNIENMRAVGGLAE